MSTLVREGRTIEVNDRIRTKIILVRHGECKGNLEGLFRGRTDFPLNETGRRQAQSVARALKQVGLSRVFSSPLSRAMETARAIADKCKIPLEVRQGFNNMALGPWEGRPKDEILTEFPEEWEIWLSHPERLSLPGSESLSDVQRRAVANLDFLVRKYPGETIAVVSHRALLKPLMTAALGIEEPSFWRLHIDTASWSLLTHEKERGYCLVSLNQTSHLDSFVSEWV